MISAFFSPFSFSWDQTHSTNRTTRSHHNTWNKYVRKFCSSISVSSVESLCCSNFWAPCTGSKREYSCCKHKLQAKYVNIATTKKDQIKYIAMDPIYQEDQENNIIPSNPQTVEDTMLELCTQLFCRALKTQPGQNPVLQNVKKARSS